jgi:hypothetical protein
MSPQGPTELKVDRTDGAVEALVVVVVGVEVDAVKGVVVVDEAKKESLKILIKKVPHIFLCLEHTIEIITSRHCCSIPRWGGGDGKCCFL